MNLQFNKNFDNLLKNIIVQAKKSNQQTILVINTKKQKSRTTPILLPTRKTPFLICLGITIFEKKSVINILKKIDGKIDYVLVDVEQKNKKLSNLIKTIQKNILKSKILTYKSNDFTVESADAFLQQLIDFSKKQKIVIVGAGNIGSKLALKIAERGFDIFISKKKYSDSLKIANALNLIKPKACTAKIIAKSNKNIAENCDLLISFSNIPAIDKKIVSQMLDDGIIIDGGIGTIQADAVKLAHDKNIRIIRLDVRAGFSGTLTTLFDTKDLLEKTIGSKKIKNFQVIAGGFYGKLGDVVLDSISSPTEIIGIADGKGGLLRKNYSSIDKKKIQITNTWIKKKINL